MGPFPHDAPATGISDQNPMGPTLEFVEYAHPVPEKLGVLFVADGLCACGEAPLQGGHALAQVM